MSVTEYGLYYARSLPRHYVYVDRDGKLWLTPVSPIEPIRLERLSAYRGNYTLQRVPDYIARFYCPAQPALS